MNSCGIVDVAPRIQEITDYSLWSLLLDTDIVQYSECNIMDCFNAIKLNESVISYINRCDIDLDFSKTEYNKADKEKLFHSVIICNDIENSKYKQILKSLNFVYNYFDIAEISDDKIIILIDTSIIQMTENNLVFIRENYPNQNFHFIHKNIEEYAEIMDNTVFSQEELLEICFLFLPTKTYRDLNPIVHLLRSKRDIQSLP